LAAPFCFEGIGAVDSRSSQFDGQMSTPVETCVNGFAISLTDMSTPFFMTH
jgi:hypothetical protein